jgi:hypothetical protein
MRPDHRAAYRRRPPEPRNEIVVLRLFIRARVRSQQFTVTFGENVMNNLYAFRLGEAARAAKPGGDAIDLGWSLARELHARGFDIVPRDRGPAGLNPATTINEMCGFPAADQQASSPTEKV